jgi:hypothetical protein
VHRRSEKSSSAHSTLKRPNKTGRFNKDPMGARAAR